MLVHLDFEVYSEVSIKAGPLSEYAAHPSTRIILAAYAFDDGPVKVWEANSGPRPEHREALVDPNNTIVAWNMNYERTVLAAKGMDIPLERWLDPMVMARYAGLPGKLKDCAKIPMIGVPQDEKTKNETLLITKFCTPWLKSEDFDDKRRTKADAPEDWALFTDYCRKDVLTMRHVLNWLNSRFPFPEREREIWLLDQRINARGLPIDRGLAEAGRRETDRLTAGVHQELRELTGLENPNSVQQILPWLKARGYKYDSLGKEFIDQAFAECESGELKTALELRRAGSKSSVKKFAAFLKATAPDGRARNQFVYGGAHTLRWSGRDIQPHNLTRKETDPATLQALLEEREAK